LAHPEARLGCISGEKRLDNNHTTMIDNNHTTMRRVDIRQESGIFQRNFREIYFQGNFREIYKLLLVVRPSAEKRM